MAATPVYKRLLKKIQHKAKKEKRENDRLFGLLKKNKPRGTDAAFKKFNDEAFAHTHCLDCANCCRVAQPVFETPDIKRIARHFKMTRENFIKKYLQPHPDYEYLTKKLPCPFLSDDNKCSIYEIRPAGCRTYPPAKMRLTPEQLVVLHENVGICPAVNEMVDRIKERFNFADK